MSANPASRRPRWVYDAGREPDPRFSLANERTLLAWLRTSAACAVTAVVLTAARDITASPWVARYALLAAVAGVVLAPAACLRWATIERAMRLGRPLPGPSIVVLALALVAGSALLALGLLVQT
jgi:putative membrane protein